MGGTLLFIRALLWLLFVLPITARLIYTGNVGGAVLIAIVAGTLVNFVTRDPDE